LFLLMGTLAVYRQIQYMRQQSLGINIDQTLVVRPPNVLTDSTYMQNMSAFKEALDQQTGIKGIAISSSIPGQTVDFNAGGIRLVGKDESASKQYRVIDMDYDYMKQYGIKLVVGRYFSKEFGTDDSAVIFNKKGFEQLGLDKPEDAIGKRIEFWGNRYTIVGVSENFHQQSLREAFEPLIFRLTPAVRGYLSVKTPASKASQTIALVKSNWNKFFPGNTFEYFFLDDHFDQQYKADQRFGQVFGLFTLLAILVACLGLFGLASFTTKVLPIKLNPLRLVIACRAADSSVISTKPKPRLRCVTLSIMILAEDTSPYSSNNPFNSESDALKGMLAT